MIENSFAITGTFIAYLILMLAIGVIAYKRTSSSSDYFLGVTVRLVLACGSVCWRFRYEWLAAAWLARLCLCGGY